MCSSRKETERMYGLNLLRDILIENIYLINSNLLVIVGFQVFFVQYKLFNVIRVQ